MYNRTIQINPSHPERALPTMTAGKGSAVTLVIEGVPLPASEVSFLLRRNGDESACIFPCAKNERGAWAVMIQDGFLTSIGRGFYEITFTDGGEYWAARGAFDVVETGAENSVAIVVASEAAKAIEEVGEEWTLKDLKAKFNTLVRALKGE